MPRTRLGLATTLWGMVAILFDLDDTLTDRARSVEAYAAHFVRDFGPAMRGLAVAGVAGAIRDADGGGYRSKEEVADRLRAALPWRDAAAAPSADALIAHRRRVFAGCAQPGDGLAETLGALDARGVPYGVVTNGGSLQRAKIEALGLGGRLRTVVVSEEAGVRKPDPRIFALALAGLGHVGPVWFVGDHPTNDVLGAGAAGLVPVWLSGRRPWPEGVPAPERRIARLPDLLGLLPSGG